MSKELKVLIVDDDKDDGLWLSEVIGEIFPSCTYEFERDGIAALRYIKNNRAVDLIFLDLNLPLKNGLDCLRDIHNLDLLPNTPIIIYSTSNNIREIDQAYKCGAACYIVKPACIKKLKDLVAKALAVSIGKPKSQRIDKADFVLMEGLKNANAY